MSNIKFKIRLTTDVIVGKNITLPMFMELEVVRETDSGYIVMFFSDTITISKFECEVVTA